MGHCDMSRHFVYRLAVLLCGVTAATLWIGPFLGRVDLFEDDAAQHVFWLYRFADPALFPGDLTARFFSLPSSAPAGYRGLYPELARFVADFFPVRAARWAQEVAKDEPDWFVVHKDAGWGSEHCYEDPTDNYTQFLLRAWVMGEPSPLRTWRPEGPLQMKLTRATGDVTAVTRLPSSLTDSMAGPQVA